jgi:hypothetical protein
MATARTIINRALRLNGIVGIGKAASNEEAEDCRIALNAMLEQWSIDSNTIYEIVDETQTITASTGTYTIGASATWNTTRPVRIETLYVRDSSGDDYAVSQIDNHRYQAIGDKTQTNLLPDRFPQAVIKFWPVPTQNLTALLTSWKQFSAFADLTAAVSLPPGYEDALAWNLAVYIAPEYGIDARPTVQQEAIKTLDRIKRVNLRVPTLSMPFDLQWAVGGNAYDINTDN